MLNEFLKYWLAVAAFAMVLHGTIGVIASAHAVLWKRDVYFRLEGPVVAQLQEVFAADWAFCTDEASTQ